MTESMSQYESPPLQLRVAAHDMSSVGYSAHFEVTASQTKPDLQYCPPASEQASPKAMPVGDVFAHFPSVQTSRPEHCSPFAHDSPSWGEATTHMPQLCSPPQDSEAHCEAKLHGAPSATVPGVTHAGRMPSSIWSHDSFW
jgi:hypothetical protein